jgi:hypothetical protein
MLTGVTSLDEIEKYKRLENMEDKHFIPDFYLTGVTELLSLIKD